MAKFLTKKEALQRFIQTFSPQEILLRKDRQHRVEILMRFILAIDMAARAEGSEGLTFSGQRPNDYDALGAYLVSGGRLFFDMSQLSPQDKRAFDEFLFPKSSGNIFYRRLAGTHKVSTKIINGKKYVYEQKLSIFESFLNAIKQIIGQIKPLHFGMDIGLGGVGNELVTHEGKKVKIKNDGEFGHLYANKHPELDAIQIGFEEAAPGKRFVPGGGWHGPDGKGSDHSAFMARKLEDQEFGENGKDKIIPQQDKNGKYAWNRIVITPDVVKEIADIQPSLLDATNKSSIENIVSILNKPPANCIEVNDYEERNKAIISYRIHHGLDKVDALSSNQLFNRPFRCKAGDLPKLRYYKELLKSAKDEFEQHLILHALLGDGSSKSLVDSISRGCKKSPETLKQYVDSWLSKYLNDFFPDAKQREDAKQEMHQKISVIRKSNADSKPHIIRVK